MPRGLSPKSYPWRVRFSGLQTRQGHRNVEAPAQGWIMQVHATCQEAPSSGCSVKDIMGASLCDLSLSARHLAQFPGKDVYKQLMMINNELSKSSLELIDITIPGRHGPGMRREMMPWLYELMPIGKLRQPWEGPTIMVPRACLRCPNIAPQSLGALHEWPKSPGYSISTQTSLRVAPF